MEVYGIVINLVVLGVLSFFDIKYRVAPNYITIPYILLGVVGVIIGFSSVDWFLNLFELVLVLLVIFAYSKARRMEIFEVFGGGDVKTLIGFSFFNSFEVFSFSIIFGAIFGIVWGVLNKRRGIEFIPFLLIGYVVSIIVFYLFGFSLGIFQHKI